MKLKIIWLLLLPFFLTVFLSCKNEANKEKSNSYDTNNFPIKYAKGFTINESDNGYYVTINNPWQNANSVKYNYFFSKDSILKDHEGISIPLKKVVCLSTTHIAFIDKLNKIDAIKGVSNPDFVTNPKIKELHRKGHISNVGYDQQINFEKVIELQPDLVFAYGVGSDISQFYNKLTELKVNTILIGEYLEDHPLAKLEWIKLFGILFDKKEESFRLFDQIEKEYNSLVRLSSNVSYRPKVFFNLPWEGTWYVPGGKSSLATFVSIAGGDYLWKDNDSKSSLPLSVETVLVKASNADVWLNPGNCIAKDQILTEYPRLKDFELYKTGLIYNNNNRISATGGNDYFESGIVNPHLILKDLITILHPEIIKDTTLHYFRKIE